jgi:flagellar hook-basal body complex protein FliE
MMVAAVHPAVVTAAGPPTVVSEVSNRAAAGRVDFPQILGEVIAQARLAAAPLTAGATDPAVISASSTGAFDRAFDRAMTNDEELFRLATAVTSRAIDAYRELMNTSV